MCGIAGFSGDFSQSVLEMMGETIRHRGPDDGGQLYIADQRIGMAHRRLSIIDLSPTGHQPMWDKTRTAAIIFNGEIYNYKSLKKELQEDGFAFNSTSDTEVVLNLYLKDNKNFLTRLNGIFAFAIWDSKRNHLLVARDGVGVKPLYYSFNRNGFIFSSEIKALLQESSVSRDLDFESIHHYLTYLWCPSPNTILKSVKKLDPGCAMIIKDGVLIDQWQFYDLPYDKEVEEDMPLSRAVNSVRSRVRTAVERQMVADVPVGAFLSGGLDSSAIAAFAQRSLPDNNQLHCFTIGFSSPSFNKEGMVEDLPYAKRVADHLGVKLSTIYVGPEMAESVEKMVYQLDEPQADPAPLNVLFISELARQNGIKVLLSGAGGDDIFTGYRRHYALTLEKYWRWLPLKTLRGLAASCRLIPKQYAIGRRFAKAFQYADLVGDQSIASYFIWSDKHMLRSLYSDSFLEQIGWDNYVDPLVRKLSAIPSGTSDLNKMLYLEGKHFLPDHNLNYTDKMGMAAGVEIRVPLLDPDLVEMACRLPVQYKQRGRVGKWIFKKAMEPYLPNDVIYRPKTGFGAPLRQWMQYELKPLVNDILSENSIKRRGLFNPTSIRHLLRHNQAGRVDASYTIFSLMCIEMWCRAFID